MFKNRRQRNDHLMRGVARLLGRRGIALFIVGAVASVLLSLVEYVIALFLVMFLYALGITPTIKLPTWIPLQAESISATWIWACMLGIALVQSVARVASFQSKILLLETVNTRLKLVLAHLLLGKRASRPMPVSEVDFLLTECFGKTAGFVFYFTQTLSFVIQVLLLTCGMVFLARGEALTGLAGLGLMALIVLKLNRMAERVAAHVPQAGAALHRIKTRVLRNWMFIRVLRIQEREYRGLLNAVFTGFRHSALSYLLANLSLAVMPVVGVLVLAAIVAVNVRLFHTPTAEFAAFLYLFIRLQQRLSNGANMMGDLFTARHQFNACLRFLDSLTPEDRAEAFRHEGEFLMRHRHIRWPEAAAAAGPAAAPPPPPPAITVHDASFRWPAAPEPVFEHLAFAVAPGALFGIVGPNGCGKSSLLGCLLGIYEPSAGRITIDGLDAAAYFERHASHMAYVGPEPYLIQGSLRDNLLYGLDAPRNDADVWQALAAVRMDEAVRAMPGALDYPIAENGEGLSSGQKQRLTIARAFLRDPTLLVMDEPSANVDEASETAIAEALLALKGRCTVMIVSHKPGILRGADATLAMDGLSQRAIPVP